MKTITISQLMEESAKKQGVSVKTLQERYRKIRDRINRQAKGPPPSKPVRYD